MSANTLTLILGNRNFSSWSLRAWLAAELSGLAFEEQFIWLDLDAERSERRRHSPTGRVPVLRAGDFAIWDSLAITEYLAERSPRVWPAEPLARARARSLAAEMHSGFQALRAELPMNCRARTSWRERGPEVAADLARIRELWSSTRAEFGAGGAFLFGAPCAADAFFAPVASRFATYAVPLEGSAKAYSDALLAWEPMARWLAAAAREGHEIAQYSKL